MPPKEELEILNLDSISRDNPREISSTIRTINRERRINIYHWVVHGLAFLIIIPFLVMLVFQLEVPREYWTLVSVVIGFYFARSLFDAN